VDILISKDNQDIYMIKNVIRVTPRIYTRIYNCSEENTMSTMPKPQDPRLRSEQFRQKVRRVFAHLGIENTQGNFRQWDRFLDWDKIDYSIDHPTRLAIYHTKDAGGNIISIMGRPEVGHQEIVACSESEASKILAKESKVFIRWWEPTRFNCGEAVMAELRKEVS